MERIIGLFIIGFIIGFICIVIMRDQIDFLKPEDFYHTIEESVYFRRMSDIDLRARKCDTAFEYMQKYKDNLQHFTEQDRHILKSLTNDAMALLKPYPRLAFIVWKFAKIDPSIEAGMPHTIGDAIVVNDAILYNDDRRTQITYLIHEKIHIYQRYHADKVQTLLTQWGFEKTNMHDARLRNNPDIDQTIYSLAGHPMATIYTTSNPTDIRDVRQLSQVEGFQPQIMEAGHPYEIMAYEVANLTMGGQPSTNLPGTHTWLKQNL